MPRRGRGIALDAGTAPALAIFHLSRALVGGSCLVARSCLDLRGRSGRLIRMDPGGPPTFLQHGCELTRV
jgi:hypothetical protein